MPIPSGTVAASRVILSDVLHDRLLEAIVAGEMRPGEKLSDASVAEWAGMSRTPVREALDRLARIHLVVVEPRKATVVAAVDGGRAADSLEALGPVVVESLRLVVTYGTDAERVALSAAVARADGARALFAADGPFDLVMLQLRNDRLHRLWSEVVPHVRRAWNLGPVPEPVGLSAAEADALATAVRRGDGDAAAAVAHEWFAAHAYREPAAHADVAPVVAVPVAASADLPEPTMLREHAFSTIADAILDGTLVPGEELDEKALIRWLDMSRQPIRHALLRLAELGLVEMVSNKQPRVAPFDPGAINRTVMLTSMWDLLTVERTAGVLSEAQLGELRRAVDAFDAGVTADDVGAMGIALRSVFQVFARAFGNAVIIEQSDRVVLELSHLLRPGAALVDPAVGVPLLHRMADAAEARDAASAVAVVRSSYGVAARLFVERFRQ